MKKSVESTGVTVDGVWFSSQTSSDKWDSVLKRSIIHEKVLDECKYTLKEIVDLLKEISLYSSVTSSKRFVEQLVREALANMPEEFGNIESSGYGQLMVRAKLVTITPDAINDYYGIVDPELVSDFEDWNQVAACLTAGTRSTWNMEHPQPFNSSTNPLLSLSTSLRQHFLRLTADLTSRFDDTRKKLSCAVAANRGSKLTNAFASMSMEFGKAKHVFDVALSGENVAKTLAGTAVYTVSNSNNEFVLISDPNGLKSIGLLCFRKEDAEAFLAQVRLRKRELRSGAKVVPITLDQVYMLKVEGIAFRFMPDPVQIQNALELKASDAKRGFDGVPVFQSDLLVVKKKNKRYCPIYFRKEDIEKELTKVPRRGAIFCPKLLDCENLLGGFDLKAFHIVLYKVGSLEDVLKKMEMSEKNSGWEDFIFIPPGKSHSQHIQEVAYA
ncbi:unnamed protein product [Rhodiola kirilowii]